MSKFKKLLPDPGSPPPDPPAPLPPPVPESVQPKPATSSAQKKLSPQAYVAVPKAGIPTRAEADARSDSDYLKVSIYLQRQTHRAAKQALLEEGESGFSELSDLIEALLTDWLGSR